MKRLFLILLLCGGSLSLILAQEVVPPQFYDEIELNSYIIMPETLLYKIVKNDDSFVLYDLREPEKFKEEHIAGAKNLPWKGARFQESSSIYPKDKDIILVSEDGRTSLKAVRYLLESGFSTVYSIEGGMQNWLYEKYLVKP